MNDPRAVLQRLNLRADNAGVAIGGDAAPLCGEPMQVSSPINGESLATVRLATPADVDASADAAHAAFLKWRIVPAPRRGELVRRIGQKLRERQADLAALVSWEAGKISAEALGEVQEMIDICDFAVGLSRQLHGLTIASERPGHRMMEQWHPLGAVGVITAFNFPVAVWAWNAMLALVCGDSVIWKPSEKTPLCALACHQLAMDVLKEMRDASPGLISVIVGKADVGAALAASERVPLISATGSVPMGRAVAQVVAGRLGRSLLELGGNNGLILTESADMELALRAIVFAAAGTCGQRCTTLRRLIVHRSISEKICQRIAAVYERLRIGHPLEEGVLVGPLVDQDAFDAMQRALAQARAGSGQIVCGGDRVTTGVPAGGFYVRPALVRVPTQLPIVREETFAPILYVMEYETLDEAIALHNDVPQGLSSAIFTRDVQQAEIFLSPVGSDCGIANVNIGTSGAEIGGAFGGEKTTGGGRESGSDTWKSYMRRATNTINYSNALPLAQGISFDV